MDIIQDSSDFEAYRKTESQKNSVEEQDLTQ
ncbi:unnamed protein product, partial [marine sediment metagenome]